jgi:hypothetical protein
MICNQNGQDKDRDMNTSFTQKQRTINNQLNVKSEAVIAVLIKIHVFWDVMPYRLPYNYLDYLNLNTVAKCGTTTLWYLLASLPNVTSKELESSKIALQSSTFDGH